MQFYKVLRELGIPVKVESNRAAIEALPKKKNNR
jgi:hypothetical protein